MRLWVVGFIVYLLNRLTSKLLSPRKEIGVVLLSSKATRQLSTYEAR